MVRKPQPRRARPAGAAPVAPNPDTESFDSPSLPFQFLRRPLDASVVLPEAGGAVVTLRAGSRLEVLAFNSADDRDPDGVLAPPGPAAGEGGLPPLVELTPDAAWLKLRFEGQVKAAGGGSLAALGYGLEASLPVVLADYRCHRRREVATRAAAAGLAAPRYAVRPADVKALHAREALLLQWGGRLEATVAVPWPELLAAELSAISRQLALPAPALVALGAGAEVRARFTVADEFLVVFSRGRHRRVRVAVRRARGRGVGVGVELSVGAAFADAEAADELVRQTWAGLLGEEWRVVGKILERAALERLAPLEREAAKRIAAKLGLAGALDRLAALHERLRSFESAADAAIRAAALARLRAGFAYEYARLGQRDVIVQASVDEKALAVHHAALLRGRTDELVRAGTAKKPGVTLERWLQRDTVRRERVSGFSLGLGPWAIASRDRRALERVQSVDLAGGVQVGYLGSSGYQGRWGEDVTEWQVDFRADTTRFVAGPLPRVPDFDLGLHVAWRQVWRKLSTADVERLLDAAQLWEALGAGGVAAARARLAGALGRPAEAAIQLRLDDHAWRIVLGALAGDDNGRLAGALAAAMSWRRGPQARTDPERRRKAYAAVWAYELEHRGTPAAELAELARKHFAASSAPELGFMEEHFRAVGPTETFVGLARIANPGTADVFADFRAAARLLDEALRVGAEDRGVIEHAYELMMPAWRQSHWVRALGAWLLEAARARGIARLVARSFTVTLRERGGDRVLLFGENPSP
jgi:hypothetical protein